MTYLQEVREAARGVWLVFLGRREALSHFDLNLRGLMGALIAVLITTLVLLMIPGSGSAPVAETEQVTSFPSESQAVFFDLLVAMAGVAAVYLYLSMAQARDRFVPYLVVNFWVDAFLRSGLAIIVFAGVGGEFLSFAIVALSVYFAFRVARLVTGLSIGHVLGLIAFQVGAGFIVMSLIFAALGGGPELLAQR